MDCGYSRHNQKVQKAQLYICNVGNIFTFIQYRWFLEHHQFLDVPLDLCPAWMRLLSAVAEMFQVLTSEWRLRSDLQDQPRVSRVR